MFENMFQKYLTTKNIIFFVVTVLFLILLSKIQDIAIMFFACYVLACSMEPLVQKLSNKFERKTAVPIVLGGGLLLVCLFFIPLLVLAGNEIKNFAVAFPQHLTTLKDFLETIPFLNHTLLNKLDITGLTSKVFTETLNFSLNLGSAFVYLLASLLIIYYFMADRDTIRETVLKLFPVEMRSKTSDIMYTISKKIGGYVVAQITTMASVGVVMTIGLFLLGVDYALLLGLITAILDIIPVVGPAIALVICLVASYKAGWAILLGITIVFSVAQLLENNFVRPYVFGKFLDIHPLIIYLFLFITAKYMGVVGVIFAPAIAATAVVLIQELYMKNLDT